MYHRSFMMYHWSFSMYHRYFVCNTGIFLCITVLFLCITVLFSMYHRSFFFYVSPVFSKPIINIAESQRQDLIFSYITYHLVCFSENIPSSDQKFIFLFLHISHLKCVISQQLLYGSHSCKSVMFCIAATSGVYMAGT